MARTPKGSVHSIATVFGSDKAITGASNATECVITCVGHGFSTGDIVFFSDSGWGRLYKRAFKVTSLTADTFKINLFNTTNTDFFPAGGGSTGSCKKVSTWVQIAKVLGIDPSGGEPKPVNFAYQEDDVDRSVNDGFTANSLSLRIDFDAIDSAGCLALQDFTDTGADTIIRTVLRGGKTILRPGTVALNPEAVLQDGAINFVRCAMNGSNRSTIVT